MGVHSYRATRSFGDARGSSSSKFGIRIFCSFCFSSAFSYAIILHSNVFCCASVSSALAIHLLESIAIDAASGLCERTADWEPRGSGSYDAADVVTSCAPKPLLYRHLHSSFLPTTTHHCTRLDV